MTEFQRTLVIGVLVVTAIGIGALGFPIVTAVNRYNVADQNGDYEGMCVSRQEVSAAWASAGFAGKAQEWQDGVALECLIARQRRERNQSQTPL